MTDTPIDATYEYNWNSLIGCLQGLLRAAGLSHDAGRVSAVTGEAFRIVVPEETDAGAAFARSPHPQRSLDGLAGDLALLGLPARVDSWDLRGRTPVLLSQRFGRRARRALSEGHAVVAWGAVEGEFGLLVGYDHERRAYRVRGPLSDEIGSWLAGDSLPASEADWLALVTPDSAPGPAAPIAALVARSAQHRLQAEPGAQLRAWAALLRSEAEIDARGHARAAQALAAAAGEASRFWRRACEEDVGELRETAEAAAELALALSRFATLFPFPMGGDVAGGGREAGARALESALEPDARLQARLPASAKPGAGPG